MSARSNILGVVAAILAGLIGTAEAQVWQPFGPVDYRHDFAPFETFDIKNMSSAPDPQEGFFFTFEKLSWSVQGEHNTIGNPDAVVFFPDVLPGVDSPRVFNGLTDSAPEATFGWGERYEFGYVNDHHGWAVSVLDGPDVTDSEVYGFIDEIFEDPLNDDATVVLHPHPSAGNVVILFEAVPELLTGFLFVDSDGDGETDLQVDVNQDGVLTLEDSIVFLTSFDRVTARNHTELDGVEVMKTYRFKPTHRGSVVEFSFGARYLRVHDQFRVDAHGGILNDLNLPLDGAAPVDDRTSFWDTTIDNHIVGPQVALRWSKRRGRFTYSAGGRFTFGYNVQDHDQVGQIGTALDYGQEGTIIQAVPPAGAGIGYDGQPMLMSNTAIRHGKQEQDFSPLVEFRTEVNYHLTQDFALKLGFNATFMDNIRRASPSVAYVLPNMGFRDAGTQEFFTAGVNFGAEFNR